MNRQLRRAQAKQDEKVEREKLKRKQARREKVDRVKASRKTKRLAGAKPAEGSKDKAPKEPRKASSLTKEQLKKMPGRFSGALMIATVFFIILQGATPPDLADMSSSLVGAGFFLMFGYFSVLFLFRRGNDRAFTFTLATGIALVIGMLLTRLIGPQEYGFDQYFLILIGLGAVGVVLGAYLGRAVFNAGLRQ